MSELKEIYKGSYLSLFSNGTFGHSDGVGYCGETSPDEVRELFEALLDFYGHDAALRADNARLREALKDMMNADGFEASWKARQKAREALKKEGSNE